MERDHMVIYIAVLQYPRETINIAVSLFSDEAFRLFSGLGPIGIVMHSWGLQATYRLPGIVGEINVNGVVV